MAGNTTFDRDRYHAAVSDLFEQATRDTAFKSNSALRDSAMAAQTALGKVEQRIEAVTSATTSEEKKLLSQKLQAAEDELDAAALAFLQSAVDGDSETVRVARELFDSLPAEAAKSADLEHVKAVFKQEQLKQKQPPKLPKP